MLFIETPVPLVPAHLPDFVRYGIVIEVHVLTLWQGLECCFYLFTKFPFGDDVQFAMLGKVHAPVPSHAGFAAHAWGTGVSVDEDGKHIKYDLNVIACLIHY